MSKKNLKNTWLLFESYTFFRVFQRRFVGSSVSFAHVYWIPFGYTLWFLFRSGIYDDPACSSTTVNHAMLLVGYTKTAWILKNWWSSRWGDNGYMYLARGNNQCAVSSYAAYATINHSHDQQMSLSFIPQTTRQ